VREIVLRAGQRARHAQQRVRDGVLARRARNAQD
jgi:hypothetical protein